MLDNALINLVAASLEAASAAAGWNYIVSQKNQPSQEGVPSAPTIFLEKLFDHHYGYPMVTEAYQPTPDDFAETEEQIFETTFQISALVPQDPTNLALPTASDVANYLKQYIQSRTTVSLWMQQDVRMLRVTEVRNPYFVDDKDRFEASPSFDIVVTHLNSITLTVGAASRAVGNPSPIPGDTNVGVFSVPRVLANLGKEAIDHG